MATNLELDDSLIQEAMDVGHHRSIREAVTAALQEYVKARHRLGILEWMGRVEYYEDYDHKKARRRRPAAAE